MDSDEGYWDGSEPLRAAAERAAVTGESVDQLFWASMARIRSAKSSGNAPHLFRMRKSSVTPYRSTSKAAIVSLMARRPFSNRDQ